MIARSSATRTLWLLVPLVWPLAAGAQIVRDGSIGPAGGALTGPSFSIPASLGQQVGGNLFHSFSQFNIGTNQSATFSGPGSVANVISRVTGPSGSAIDGVLRSSIPGANVWLINPHGVAFGPNASLDVQGSVHIATADYLKLGSSGQFNAANPGASTLAAAPPSAFGFLGAPAPITLDHSALVAANGKGIHLAGGDISFNAATLQAAGGRISVASQGAINASASTLDVSSGPMPASGSIRIVGGHFNAVDTTVRADNAGSADGGGISIELAGALQMTGGGILSHASGAGRSADIRVRAQDMTLLGGAEVVSAVRSGTSRGGEVNVTLGRALHIDGVDASGFASGLFATTDAGATGPAGSISVATHGLTITHGGSISASTYGTGAGGTIRLDVAGKLNLRGEGPDLPSSIYARAEPGSAGAAGSLTVRAGSIDVLDGAGISAATFGGGAGGNVDVRASGALHVGGTRSTTGFSPAITAGARAGSTGPAGSVTAEADSVRLDGYGEISADTFGPGAGGDVRVTARAIQILDASNISSVTWRKGRGGNVSVSASESIGISGHVGGAFAGIYSSTNGRGASGDVAVQAPDIQIDSDGVISADSFRYGNAGALTISADRLSLSGGGSIESSTFGPGRAGDIAISAGRVHVSGGSPIGISYIASDSTSGGTGDAGSITIDASRLRVSANAQISTNTDAAGAGGDITIGAGKVFVGRGGSVVSSTFGGGHGGSISVSASGVLRVTGESARDVSRISSDSLAGSTGAAGAVTLQAGKLLVDANAEVSTDTQASGAAGDLSVAAGRVRVLGGGDISSSTFGAGKAGDISVKAADMRISGRSVTNVSYVSSDSLAGGTGDAGDIRVRAGRLALAAGAEISTDTTATGAAGDIRVSAARVTLASGADISSSTFGDGNAGDVAVRASQLVRVAGVDAAGFGSHIQASSSGAGLAGDVSVSGRYVQVAGGGVISSSTFAGADAGRVLVRAAELTLSGRTPLGASGIFATSQGSGGDAGSVRVKAGNVRVLEGAGISTATFGAGRGGDVVVSASGLSISGGPAGSSFIAAETVGSGDAGNVSVTAAWARLDNLGEITSSTFGAGMGGDVRVTLAGSLLIKGFVGNSSSGIFATSQAPVGGAGGSINLSASDIVVRDGATISASSNGSGAAGSIGITARSVRLINDGFIGTRAKASDGGDISIDAADLVYLRDSAITTSVAGGLGNGGNITIDPQFVVLDHSQIIANAFGGNGGNIRIVADNFLSQESLVQASSQLGVSGNVAIESPRIDLSGALRALSTDYLDTSRLIRGSCASRAQQAASTFIAGGRGGLAAAPRSGQELAERRPVALGCGPSGS